MNVPFNIEDYDTTNVVPFIRPATGGSDPPNRGGKNWLRELPQNCHFLARRKGYLGSDLEDFVVATDPTKMEVVLLARNMGGSGMLTWHISEEFSKEYRLIYTLEVLDANPKQVQPGSVDSTAEPQIIPPVYEDE